MKKIIFILTIFFTFNSLSFGANCTENLHFLNLSEKQTKNIELIEKQYRYDVAQLNADIILKNMQIAMIKGKINSQSKINSLNAEINMINDELIELQNQKQEQIIANLGLIQRFKYKRYLKSID